MKAALIVASLVLIANQAYAEKASHAPRSRTSQAVRSMPSATNAAPKPAPKAESAKTHSPGPRSGREQMEVEEIHFNVVDTPPAVGKGGAASARAANPIQTRPSENVVQGNYIGTNIVGTAAVGAGGTQNKSGPVANTPDGFQALTRNEKIQAPATPRANSNPSQIVETPNAPPALQQQMQSENR